MTLIEKCESLEETLKMAQEEALDIQKATKTENLDVMHISQAREIVAMRIGYLQRQKEKADADKAAAKTPVAEKAADDAPKTEGGGSPQ